MRKIVLGAIAALTLGFGSAHASDAPKPPVQKWAFDGLIGTYDRPALKRGFQIYKEVCANCHSLRLIAFRNLQAIGLTEDQVKEVAAGYQVVAGPDDEGNFIVNGELRKRPGVAADRFPPPFANDNAARSANGGALPPDLSLIVRSRPGGANYIHALLTGYKEEAPEGVTLGSGMSYNQYFPGHQIAMAPPLMEGVISYEDGTPTTLDQYAKDITTFLAWTSSPEMEDRKRLGIKTLLFLIVLTGMMYALKRKIWADLH
ncbi:MAG: cytochrome c1 [Magnetospirillum sp. WYHS-4]